MRQFYINVRVIYDKSIPKKVRIKLATTDEILKDTLHEANKNQVHKDDKYQPKQLSSLKELISTLKERLEHCMKLCQIASKKNHSSWHYGY